MGFIRLSMYEHGEDLMIFDGWFSYNFVISVHTRVNHTIYIHLINMTTAV